MVPLHIVPLIYFYEPDLTTPESLLDRYATISPFAKALQAEGVRITIMQRSHTNLAFSGVDTGSCSRAHSCRPALRKCQIPGSFHSSVRTGCTPDPVSEPLQAA